MRQTERQVAEEKHNGGGGGEKGRFVVATVARCYFRDGLRYLQGLWWGGGKSLGGGCNVIPLLVSDPEVC